MMKEYDLVIVGGGQLGFDAARRAAAYHGRVALVTQGVGFDPGPLWRAGWLDGWRWEGEGACNAPVRGISGLARQRSLNSRRFTTARKAWRNWVSKSSMAWGGFRGNPI
ncbi:MAG: hypothetical protein HC860_12295 [Alkalinema sp. RU_4_3]|nr:hypothetical protein [Alkalinema sp. RU_4_3]